MILSGMVLTSGFTLGLSTSGPPGSVEYLLVGGGAAGASSPNIGSGGGGAGGFVSNTGYTVTTTQPYTITVGAGGTGVNAGGGNNGVNSSLTSPAQQYSYQFSYTSPANYVATASSSTFNLSLGDWTIEGWYNLDALEASQRYMTFYPASGSPVYGVIPGGSGYALVINTFGTSNVLIGTIPTTAGVWTHVALVSSSGTITLYINGVVSGTSSNSWCVNTDTQILFGGQPAGQSYAYWYAGYISNIRIVMGTAVYTGAFTPPALAPLATSGAASAASYASTTNVNITFPASNTKFLTAQSSTLVDNSLTNNIVGVTTPTNSTSPIGVVAIGGGTGGYYNGGSYINSSAGGSGGGAAWNGSDLTTYGAALQPTSASGGLGNHGGLAAYIYSGGGGGGAGSVGGNASSASSGTGGDGGAGTSTTFVPNYSISFNGSSQYLTAPSSSAFAFTGDFTVEAWVYLTSGSTYQFLMGSSATGGMMIGLNVPISGTPTIAVGTHNVAWVLNFGSSISISTATWTHIAISRSGSTNRAFVNGVQLGSNITDSTSWAFTSNSPLIATNALSNFFGGNISNLRIVNGTALYTTNFAIPTPPLLAITNTSLLTAQSSTIVDNSTNAFTITATGSPTVSSSTIPTAYYAGGGGGGPAYGTGGIGGVGGGGTGGTNGGAAATAGATNTGGGGGAAAYTGTYGGNGGSGVAIIRYPESYTAATLYPGATYTVSGGYRIYTYTSSGSISWQSTFPVDYLVVAGGGGGGQWNSGGGGAGGLLTNTGLAVTSGLTLTVSVGAGGAGASTGTNPNGDAGSNGNQSTLTGSTPVTAIGGGGGGAYTSAAATNGGSGGGAGVWATGASGGTGTVGQGNDGGSSTGATFVPPYVGAGGGGAGAVGQTANLGNGGDGVTSSMSGASTYYAGGGGGGGNSGYGTGGQGGGGDGSTTSGVSGTANTGGGGGGGGTTGTGPGGNGGSGIVIVRYADSYAAASATTGSPTITVTGGYRIYKWTSSGSITF